MQTLANNSPVNIKSLKSQLSEMVHLGGPTLLNPSGLLRSTKWLTKWIADKINHTKVLLKSDKIFQFFFKNRRLNILSEKLNKKL